MRATIPAYACPLFLTLAVWPALAAGAPKTGLTDAQLIASAISAAPSKVARNAAVVVMEAGGKTRTLRAGTNGFTCMPDDDATPGPDQMCIDRNSMEWVNAWAAHKAPPAGKVGLIYMLAGGIDASNTDPYATKPAANSRWIKSGPHIMIIGADASFFASYPKSVDAGAPYVMWAGTPYEHLMVPVK